MTCRSGKPDERNGQPKPASERHCGSTATSATANDAGCGGGAAGPCGLSHGDLQAGKLAIGYLTHAAVTMAMLLVLIAASFAVAAKLIRWALGW